MVRRRRNRFALLVGLGVAIWRKLRKGGCNTVVVQEPKAVEPVVPITRKQNPSQLRVSPRGNPIEDIQAPAPPPAIDLKALPGPAFSNIADILMRDVEGKTCFACLKSTCQRFRQDSNIAVTHLRSQYFLVDDTRLRQISRFSHVESLHLKLGAYTPSVLTDALDASRHLTDLFLAGVGDATALCECLSRKTLLRTLSLENSALRSLNFISTLDSLTSFSLMESTSVDPRFRYWNNLRSLAKVSIDKSDGIANANMTSLSAISGLEYLHLGLTDFEEEGLLTLKDSKAKLSLRFYEMGNTEKLSSIQQLPILDRLSLVSCDLHRLPFSLHHLKHLRHFHLLTHLFTSEDLQRLEGVTEQLQSLDLEIKSSTMEIIRRLCNSALPLETLKLDTEYFEPGDSLNNCFRLKALDISATGEVCSNIFSCFRFLSGLERLTLKQCVFSTKGLENLHSFCPRLRFLSIGACPIFNQDLEYISQVASLETLELLSCYGLTTIAPLNRLKCMKHLKIEQCVSIERNLETILNDPVLTRLENLQIDFTVEYDPTPCIDLFTNLRRRSSCLVLNANKIID